MISENLDYLVDVLQTAGIDATVDPPALNPPAAWVTAKRLDRSNLSGGWAVVADVFFIVPDNGIPHALLLLDDLLMTALDAINNDDHLELTDTALDEAVTLPQGGSPLPAYRLTITIE